MIVPVYSTREIWDNFVKPAYDISDYLQEDVEDFVIARIEDYKHLVNLPTDPHRRRVNEVVFVTQGSVVRGSNLNKITIGPGMIHFNLQDSISTVDSFSEDVKGYYCHFSKETIIRLYHQEHMAKELSEIERMMIDDSLKLPNDVALNVQSIFERLVNEYTGKRDLNLVDAYLVTLCYEVKSVFNNSGINCSRSKSYLLVERFKKLIVEHIYLEHDVQFYAHRLGISPNHLNKVVKSVTGKTANGLISDMLLLEAKVLLRHTRLSISEVSYKLGFTDQSYFARFFKKHSNSTPSFYRDFASND